MPDTGAGEVDAELAVPHHLPQWGDKPAFCGNEAVIGLYKDSYPVCVTVDPKWLAANTLGAFMCTGSHHFASGVVVMCECECHTKIPENYVTGMKR